MGVSLLKPFRNDVFHIDETLIVIALGIQQTAETADCRHRLER
jgi:hypothetical protein